MMDRLRAIIAAGGSVRTAAGEVVTDVDQLEAALAREFEVSTAKRPTQFPSRDDLQSLIDNLQPENVALKTQVGELTDKNAALIEQNTKLVDQNGELATEVDRAEHVSDGLREQIATLTAENESLKVESEALKAENESLKQQIADTPSDLNNDGKIDDLESMKVPALKELAKSLNIDGADGMGKIDLISTIRAKQAEQGSAPAGGE